MLFVTYWELNENMSFEERQAAARRLVESGLFPPAGVEVLRWDSTADGWGILICEADSAEAMGQALNLWRAAGTGFFKMTKTATASPVEEALNQGREMLEKLGSV